MKLLIAHNMPVCRNAVTIIRRHVYVKDNKYKHETKKCRNNSKKHGL